MSCPGCGTVANTSLDGADGVILYSRTGILTYRPPILNFIASCVLTASHAPQAGLDLPAEGAAWMSKEHFG
jgi:hypothetical protein